MFGRTDNQKIASLEGDLSRIKDQLAAVTRDASKAHDRIDQANLRTANIEHYTGMRSHSFENGGRMWNYMQMHKDIAQGLRPQSLFATKHRMAQAA